MIAWLALQALSLFPRLSAGRARQLAWGLVIAVALVGMVITGIALKSRYDAGVVESARQTGNAAAIEGKASADERAAGDRQSDVVRAAVEQREIEEAIDVQDPVDARRAYYRCVRLQQAARAAGRPASSCS